MIRNLRKKGFTIVELVIVIAVIAILAAILIPTFSGIIKKANIASDTAMAKNMNTALVMADSEGNKAESMSDVLFTLYEAGYILENLNPTTNGYYFVWDQESNQILFLTDKFEVHYSSQAYSKDTLNWWMPMDELSDIIVGQQFSYCMATDIEGAIPKFTYLANFDTNGFVLKGNLEYEVLSSTGKNSFNVSGVIEGTLTINTPYASVNHYGAITNVVITAVASASYHEYGFVSATLELSKGRLVVENSGNASTVVLNVIAAEGSAENKGYIGILNNMSETPVTLANTGFVGAEQIKGNPATEVTSKVSGQKAGEATLGYVILIDNLTQLEAFRDAVNAGMTCKGLTVKLTADIDMSGKAWKPIGYNNRDLDLRTTEDTETAIALNVFMGEFDGNGKTIKGLSNLGYSVTDIKLYAKNAASVNGYHYGLFSIVCGAEIRNLNLTNVNINVQNGKIFAAGAIVGAARGGLTVKNCIVKGNIEANDSAGEAVGYVMVGTYFPLHYNKNISYVFENIDVDANVHTKHEIAKEGMFAGGILGRINPGATGVTSITDVGATNKFAMTDCKFSGTVLADGLNAGGLFNVAASTTFIKVAVGVDLTNDKLENLLISGNRVENASIRANGVYHDGTILTKVTTAARFFSFHNDGQTGDCAYALLGYKDVIKNNTYANVIVYQHGVATTAFNNDLIRN